MKNKYQQAEEYIKLTPDMEQRILEKIRASRTAPVPQIQPQPPFPRRFPIPAALAACFALAVLTLFLYPRLKTGFPPGQSQQPPVQIASPIVEYPDTSSLADALPFPLSLPAQLPEGYTLRSCSILNGEMAQLIYEKNGSQLTYRITEQKNAPGDDISGDYSNAFGPSFATFNRSLRSWNFPFSSRYATMFLAIACLRKWIQQSAMLFLHPRPHRLNGIRLQTAVSRIFSRNSM